MRRIAPSATASSCADGPAPDPTPLDIALHGPGRANIPTWRIHLWRWRAFQVTGAPAFVVGAAARYKFSPLGHDMPLFSPLDLPESFTALLTRDNVPQPIARAELARFYESAGAYLPGGRRRGRRRRARYTRRTWPTGPAARGAWCRPA